MMFKLLKHEFAATGRIMGAIYAVVAIIMGYELISYAIQREEATITQMLGICILILVSSCMFILTAVIMVTNFQKTLYGDQGYLSFTLPVKSISLFTSKVLTSIIWFILAFACLMGTLAITLTVAKEDMLGDNYESIETLLPVLMGGKSIGTIVTYLAVELVSLFISFATFTVEIYFAITLANTRKFQKLYTLWTIIFSIAIIVVVEIIASKISENVTFGLSIAENGISLLTNNSNLSIEAMPIDLVKLVTNLIFGAGFFYGTFAIMSKKVNIR